MLAFLNELTHDERALLSHLATKLLDQEAPPNENRSRQWDAGKERITHTVETAAGTLEVQGFMIFHASFSRPLGMNMSGEAFEFLSGIANYQPDILAKKFAGRTNPAFSMLSSGRTSSSLSMFDHPIEESRPMRLSLADARLTINERGGRDKGSVSLMDGVHQWDISLTGDQYLRMLRGEHTRVPCTINRSFGYLNDEPDNRYLEPNRQSDHVERSVKEMTSELSAKVREMTKILSAGAVTTKKKLNLLSDLADEADQCWADVRTRLIKLSDDGIENVKHDFKRRLSQQLEQDAHLLTQDDNQMLTQLIGDL